MKPTVVCFDIPEAQQPAYRKDLADHCSLVLSADALSAQTIQLGLQAEVISTHSSRPVDGQLLSGLSKLRHLICRSLPPNEASFATAQLPPVGERAAAEFTLLQMLAVSRRVMLSAHSVHAGKITASKLTGQSLAAKNLGLIGKNAHLVHMAEALGLRVSVAAPANIEGTRRVLAGSDYICFVGPPDAAAAPVLDRSALRLVKRGVIITNTAHGSLIDTAALTEALESGLVGGAALDFLNGDEVVGSPAFPGPSDVWHLDAGAKLRLGIDRLTIMPTVLITPHNSRNTVETLNELQDETVQAIRRALQHQA